MKVGLVFSISNFFINEIALANTRMSFSCSNLALAEQSQEIHSKWCHAGWKKLSFWVKIVVFLWVTQLVTTIVFFLSLRCITWSNRQLKNLRHHGDHLRLSQLTLHAISTQLLVSYTTSSYQATSIFYGHLRRHSLYKIKTRRFWCVSK